MRNLAPILLAFAIQLPAQIKHTSVPLGDAVTQALSKSQITAPDAQPFHIRINITEPENPNSPYQGTIEEWWLDQDNWRREVTDKDGMHQTIVVTKGSKTEKDEGDYFPLWLRSFVTAVFDPIPNAAAFQASGSTIDQITMPDGAKSSPNVRLQTKIGAGDRATDAFSNLSFDNQGRLSFYGSPRYSMEFHDYRPFGKKQVAYQLINDPEPGTKLVAQVVVLENESKASPTEAAVASTFSPLPAKDGRFLSVAVSSAQLEQFTASQPAIAWPAVHSGNTRGHLAIYVGIDQDGQVREAWPLNSDNAGLEDPTREQVKHWKLTPAKDQAGNPVQIDGALGFLFDTKIDNPLPVVTGPDIQKQLGGCTYNPTLKAGLLPSGTIVKVRYSVNEKGKLTGESFSDNNGFKVMYSTGLSGKSCHFLPYLVNGQPSYYFIDFVFTAP